MALWLNLQDELAQQKDVVERLRGELDTAREDRNQLETRYSESLGEVETLKEERDEVKKFSEVTLLFKLQRVAIKRPYYKNYILKAEQPFYTKFSEVIKEEVCDRQTNFCTILRTLAKIGQLFVLMHYFSVNTPLSLQYK